MGRAGLLALLIAVASIISLAGGASTASGQEGSPLQWRVQQTVRLNDLGFVYLNTSFTATNSGAAPVTLPAIDLILPTSYDGKVRGIATKGAVPISAVLVGAAATAVPGAPPAGSAEPRISLRPDSPVTLAAGTTAQIQVTLLLDGLVKSLGDRRFQFVAALTPAASVPLRVNATLQLPANVELQGSLDKFTKQISGTLESWKISGLIIANRTQARFENITVSAKSVSDFALTRIPFAMREIAVDASGRAVVRDTVTVENIGDAPLKRLNLHLLNRDVRSVTVLPIGEPPLRNRFNVTVGLGGLIDLERDLKTVLEKGQRTQIHLEYGLPPRLMNATGGSLALRIPTTPPVDGVVNSYQMMVRVPETFQLLTGPVTRSVRDATPLKVDQLEVSVRPGAAWVTTTAFPIASVLFLISLIGFAVREARGAPRLEQAREAPRLVSDFVRAFEEKVAGVQELLAQLSELAIDRGTRAHVAEARRTFDELRPLTQTRTAEARRELLTAKPGLQRLLDQIAVADREFEHAAREALNVFEQAFSGRMKRATFERTVPSYVRRVARLAEQLVDLLNTMQREFER